jgi:hypothetical protein
MYAINTRFFPGAIIENVPLAIRDRVYHYESYLLVTNMNNVNDNALVPVTMEYGYLTPRDGSPRIPALEKGERWYYGMYLLKDI